MSGSDLQSQIRNSINIATGDGPEVDAFGRLRVATPYTLFDSKSTFDAQALLFDDVELSGVGTATAYSSNTSSVVISVGSNTAVRVRQSKRRLPYQPGKSQSYAGTFTLGAAAAGITRRVGIFDADNGLFLQQDATNLSFVIRSRYTGTAVDRVFPQSMWNIDKLDGTGVSGYTLDVTKSNILQIDYEWLGVGRVRFGFNIAGQTRYAHEYAHANAGTGVYMSSPNLPVRYEIANDGAATSGTLECICSTVISEGGTEFTGFEFSADRGSNALTTLDNDSTYPLLAIRLKPTHLGATIRPIGASILCTSTATAYWALLLNPTIVGVPLTFTGIPNSAIDAATTATNATTVTGGTLLASGYDASTNQTTLLSDIATQAVPLGAKVDGTADILVLAVQRLVGTTETFYGSLRWLEQV